jgi:ADP-ribose pyrophosphatase
VEIAEENLPVAASRLLLTAKRFRVIEVEVPQPDGQIITRQVVEHPGAVVVVPILPNGNICLIRNFRLAVGKTLLELPAGTLEAGESPQQTAARELREETGYEAAHMTELAGFYMSPGILTERMYAFVATGLVEHPPAREAGEDIENYIVSPDEAMSLIQHGDIEDAKSIATLLYYDRFCRSRAEQ